MAENVPSSVEIVGLVTAAGLMAASVGASIGRSWKVSALLKTVAAVCGWFSIIVGGAVLVSHSAGRGGWLPLDDNFDSLGASGLMLATCALYIQAVRPVGGLDWVVLPVAALLLIGAAVFGRTLPHEYGETAWSWTHRLTAYGGALALVIAGAVGALYLLAAHRLRAKGLASGSGFGNLERLETIAQHAMALGWPLFTIGLVTGILWGIHLTSQGQSESREFFGPKVMLAVGVWIVYALALHTPINPSFRGRKAAVLSLIGLVLMAGTLVAVQFMPGGTR